MTRTLVTVVVGICGLTATMAAAQSALPITVNQRVRVWTAAAEAVTGQVVTITPTTLQIAVDGREQTTVAVATVRRVEVSRGGTSRGAAARKWGLRGALIAGVIGAISLGLQHDAVGEDGSSAGEAAALGAFSGGLFGGLIGAGIGAARAGEQWEPVWP
jgi:hypothetical protein